MHVVKVDKEQFNKQRFDKRELATEDGFDEIKAIEWALSIDDLADDILYKFKRQNGILWYVKVAIRRR